jgi:site-specific recombinase XerD
MESHSPKLLDRVREAIRLRHYSRRTEDAYVLWIRRFIVFHGKRHPRELGEADVTAFISSLATRGVSPSTQNQALSAVLFLYEVIIGRKLPWMDAVVRARRPARLPVMLSRKEVGLLLGGPLADHLVRVKAQHEADLGAGRGSVELPGALRAKYPNTVEKPRMPLG